MPISSHISRTGPRLKAAQTSDQHVKGIHTRNRLLQPRLDEIATGKYKVLVAVIGTTDKGLGASGITIEDEINNLKQVIEAAKAKGMPIVAVHIEQDKRAPKIPTNGNERIIDLICPIADWMIVCKTSNPDGRFDKIKADYGVPLTTVDSALEFSQLCSKIFIK